MKLMKHPLVAAFEAAIVAKNLACQKLDEADLVATHCDHAATLKSEREAECTAAVCAVQAAQQAVMESDEAFPNFVRYYGHLANHLGRILPLQVYKSGAGFYIGTYDDEGPCSRESNEYFRSEKLAQEALSSGNWTQKMSL